MAFIDFSTMPVGCSWQVRYSDGTTLRETFLGKKSGLFVTEVTKANAPNHVVRRAYFDRKGRMVQKAWSGQKCEMFTPYSCFDGRGKCSYRYTNADGGRSGYRQPHHKNGKGFKVVAGPRGEPAYPEEYFETGAFGGMTVTRAQNYSARATRFSGCGAAGS